MANHTFVILRLLDYHPQVRLTSPQAPLLQCWLMLDGLAPTPGAINPTLKKGGPGGVEVHMGVLTFIYIFPGTAVAGLAPIRVGIGTVGVNYPRWGAAPN